LVNKQIVTWQIARWLLLSQEFDFNVIYKPSKIHFLPNHLSRINHGELVEGIEDHLSDAHLFNMNVYKILNKRLFWQRHTKEKRKSHISIKTRPYDTLYDNLFYRLGPNCVLHQCLSPMEATKMLEIFMKGQLEDISTIILMSKNYWHSTIGDLQ
jgi:hypothetical protein